jgi:signal transduction histidine kinase
MTEGDGAMVKPVPADRRGLRRPPGPAPATLWLIGRDPADGGAGAGRRTRASNLILAGAVALAALIFVLDLETVRGVAVPVLYSAVLAACLWLPWSRAVLVAAAVASGLTVGAYLVTPGLEMVWPALLNRLLALVAIWAAALLLFRFREMHQELVRVKAAAERSQRSKTRFLSAAGHDLRHPIQAGVLFQELLARRLKDSPHIELVEHLGQSFVMMQRMLEGLLEVSRFDLGTVQPSPAPLAVNALFSRLTPPFAAKASAAGLTLTVVRSRAVIKSDPDLLLRIVQNLLDNAIKYTEHGRVVVGCRRSGANLLIQVWDTGIGIPEERMHDIFEEFHQLRRGGRDGAKGLGMGLAVVERLARLLGHAIGIRSTLGRGSMFEVVVPLWTGARVGAGTVA